MLRVKQLKKAGKLLTKISKNLKPGVAVSTREKIEKIKMGERDLYF